YFGLGQHAAQVQTAAKDTGDDIRIDTGKKAEHHQQTLWDWKSPGLWAIVSIIIIGAFNLLGPKHSAGFALFAAAGMIVITLIIVVFAVPKVDWAHRHLGGLR